MMRRRSTRAEIVERELRSAEVIAELVLLGADDVAAQVTRCWHDRLFGDPQLHRYRCRSCACLSCRRPSLNAYWRAYVRWSGEGGATSYFSLSSAAPLTDVAKISKSLRNLRDQLARESWLFEDLGFLAVADDRHVHVLASHPGVSRQQVGERLRQLWPGMVLEDAPTALLIELGPQLLARTSIRRRGLQPLRFVISPRGC